MSRVHDGIGKILHWRQGDQLQDLSPQPQVCKVFSASEMLRRS
jgi:hypothetical protein